MQSITDKINKPEVTLKLYYMSLFFETLKCVDAICVIQLLYYEPMVWIVCPKPSSLCGNELLCILAI